MRFVGLAVLLAGCGGGALETATELPKAPRRPDGVVLEPPPALPEARDRAPATGVVGLREPIADREIEDVVGKYFDAFVHENLDGLATLLGSGATYLGAQGARAGLLEMWRGRMRSFEYQQLVGVELYRPAEVERHAYDTLGVPGAPTRPAAMQPGDVLVRVPVLTPNVSGEQLFGEVVVLLLRRDDGRLRIVGAADEANR